MRGGPATTPGAGRLKPSTTLESAIIPVVSCLSPLAFTATSNRWKQSRSCVSTDLPHGPPDESRSVNTAVGLSCAPWSSLDSPETSCSPEPRHPHSSLPGRLLERLQTGRAARGPCPHRPVHDVACCFASHGGDVPDSWSVDYRTALHTLSAKCGLGGRPLRAPLRHLCLEAARPTVRHVWRQQALRLQAHQ